MFKKWIKEIIKEFVAEQLKAEIINVMMTLYSYSTNDKDSGYVFTTDFRMVSQKLIDHLRGNIEVEFEKTLENKVCGYLNRKHLDVQEVIDNFEKKTGSEGWMDELVLRLNKKQLIKNS